MGSELFIDKGCLKINVSYSKDYGQLAEDIIGQKVSVSGLRIGLTFSEAVRKIST